MAEAQGADQARIVTSAQPPKLSLADFKIYNSMADHMELFVQKTLSICVTRLS